MPESATAWSAAPIIDWLFHKGRRLPADELLAALCERVMAAGLPLDRVRVYMQTLHPLYFGTMLRWSPEDGADTQSFGHESRARLTSLSSPVKDIYDGARLIRLRLEQEDGDFGYSVVEDLRADGITDYLATALVFSNGEQNVLTLATKRPGGFSGHDLAELDRLLHIFTLLYENHVNRSIAQNVLDAYLGPISGARVLNGQVQRGDGQSIEALIWFSDLRDSTPLSESLDQEAFLEMLNDYFEATAGALLEQGGEVLRFIGDASLGVIPVGASSETVGVPSVTEKEACTRALAAVRDAGRRSAERNAARTEAGKSPFRYGIGLHLGTVLYGNIGVPKRVEFSVIGPAANHAARIEGLCKTLGRTVIVSDAVAAHAPGACESLGFHSLRGAAETVELFGLAE